MGVPTVMIGSGRNKGFSRPQGPSSKGFARGLVASWVRFELTTLLVLVSAVGFRRPPIRHWMVRWLLRWVQLGRALSCELHGVRRHVRLFRLWAQFCRSLPGRMIHPGPRSRILWRAPVARVPTFHRHVRWFGLRTQFRRSRVQGLHALMDTRPFPRLSLHRRWWHPRSIWSLVHLGPFEGLLRAPSVLGSDRGAAPTAPQPEQDADTEYKDQHDNGRPAPRCPEARTLIPGHIVHHGGGVH